MNKNLWISSVLIALVMLIAVMSCAPRVEQPPRRGTDTNPYDFEKEGTVPSQTEDQVRPETDFEEIPLTEDDVVGEEVEAPRDTTRIDDNEPAGAGPGSKPGGIAPVSGVSGKDGTIMTPVFRVQIVALQSEASAQDAKRTAQLRLKLPVYVKFVDGMYKVHVGDCSTRAEVEKVLRRCRESGYPDAWVVTGAVKSGGTQGGENP